MHRAIQRNLRKRGRFQIILWTVRQKPQTRHPRRRRQQTPARRIPPIPLLQEWWRDDLPQRLRRQNEGRTEGHLLHHRGDQSRSCLISLRRSPHQIRYRGSLYDRPHRWVRHPTDERLYGKEIKELLQRRSRPWKLWRWIIKIGRTEGQVWTPLQTHQGHSFWINWISTRL